MSWIGVWHRERRCFDAAGLTEQGEHPRLLLREPDALLAAGSLVVEFELPMRPTPDPVIRFARGGDWPLLFELNAGPDGAVELQLHQYGHLQHQRVHPVGAGRGDRLRLTLSWNAPAFCGQLTVERLAGGPSAHVALQAPRPWRLDDLRALLSGPPEASMAPTVTYVALSAQQEPTGPMPGLTAQTPVETDHGPRPIAQLQRGDLLRVAGGDLVPVLHVVRRRVPAFGAFRPVQLRAPFFGLSEDLFVAPSQRVLLTGSEVEYLFGCEAVLAAAETLATTRIGAMAPRTDTLVDYFQVVLPGNEAPIVAGLAVESLFLGRIRRDRARLSASLLADIDRNSLPEHATSPLPVVRAFDAAVLAEQRSA